MTSRFNEPSHLLNFSSHYFSRLGAVGHPVKENSSDHFPGIVYLPKKPLQRAPKEFCEGVLAQRSPFLSSNRPKRKQSFT